MFCSLADDLLDNFREFSLFKGGGGGEDMVIFSFRANLIEGARFFFRRKNFLGCLIFLK